MEIKKVALIRIDKTPETLSKHPRHIHPATELKYIELGLNQLDIKSQLFDGWIHLWSPEKLAEQIDQTFDMAIHYG